MALLPKLHTCTDIIGNVSERFAAFSGLSTNTKVVGGLFDVNAYMLGAGRRWGAVPWKWHKILDKTTIQG